jgi:flagellar L-ring protein precursor FlgH
MKLIFTIFLLFVFATGCSSFGDLKDPEYAPSEATLPEVKTTVDGAIYDPSFNLFLFEDVKARRVGDLITVVLEESINASKSASTDASKNSNVELPNPTLFGKVNRIKELTNDVETTRDFQGDGETTQENSIQGNITVTVHRVHPNGYLFVKGEKLLSLNEGSEVVRISGIVRPTDVTSNNTILSNQIANAEITYKGNGIVSDSGKAGWLLRFFSSVIWPI